MVFSMQNFFKMPKFLMIPVEFQTSLIVDSWFNLLLFLFFFLDDPVFNAAC